MSMGWCFYSHLVLRFTNRHQNKPSFSFLCLWCIASTRILYFGVQTGTKNKPIFSCFRLRGGALSRILYFGAQAGTNTNLSLVVYVYGVVL